MATTAADPVFVDTNVLVYANTVRSPLHIRAQLALQDLSASAIPLWISRQILREYLATLSRPQTFSAPVSQRTGGGSGDHCPNQLPTEIVRRARPQ